MSSSGPLPTSRAETPGASKQVENTITCPKMNVCRRACITCSKNSRNQFCTQVGFAHPFSATSRSFMICVFAYCRVSTAGQVTDNQTQEMAAAGFRVQPSRVIAEAVSGSIAAMKRPGFKNLMDKLVTCWSSPNWTDWAVTPWTCAPRWKPSPVWMSGCTALPWAA